MTQPTAEPAREIPPDPLYEITRVRQIPGESPRRWFCSADFDLVVWLDAGGHPAGFELCYDKRRDEHALRWSHAGGFRHLRIDDGEQRPGKYKGSPVLEADGRVDADRLCRRFAQASGALPPEIGQFIAARLASLAFASPALT